MTQNSRLFDTLHAPYYIHAPAYQEASGGVRALHYLCHALNLMGEEAYIVPGETSAFLRTPRLTPSIQGEHIASGRQPVVVYPEVISENPMNAQNIVRFLLNFPGHLSGVQPEWDANDLIYTHGVDVVPAGMHAALLQVPLVNTLIFNKNGVDNSERSGKLLWISRFIDRGGKLDSLVEGATEISARSGLRTPQQLADLYRSAEALYTYEPSTACYEALMCGCPVVYLPNDVMLQTPMVGYLTDAGSAWGGEPEKLDEAKRTISKIPEIYAALETVFWRQLDSFIVHTQDHVRTNAVRSPAPQRLFVPMAHSVPLPSNPATSYKVNVKKKRLLIFSIESSLSPCPQIRLLRPFAYLKKEWELIWGIKDGQLLLDEIEQADMILMHRYTPGLIAIPALENIFSRGKPVIYETDDLLNEMPEYHPQGGAAWKTGIEYTIRHAQAVIVSTPYLADKYRSLNPAVHILPNFIDFEAFFRPVPRRPRQVITIGLLGTSIQSPNFDLVDASLRALCDIYQERIKIYFVGWAPPKGWENHPNTEFIPVIVEYADYAARLRQMQWSIALVPLAADNFNRSKSAIKWLEYSAAGIATVFSDVPIYSDVVTHGETGLLAADSTAAWTDAITTLIEDNGYRHRIASTAQSAVRDNYALKDKVDQYGQTYGEIANSSRFVRNDAAVATPSLDASPKKLTMLVYSLDPKNSPCSQIRLVRPFQLLKDRWNFIWAWDELNSGDLLGRANVVILHRTFVAQLPRPALDAVLDSGKVIIYESDDLLNEIPKYHRDAEQEQREAIEYTIGRVHAVVVSSQYLAEKYRLLNPVVHVLPNFVDYKLFHRPVPPVRDTITVGLLGTSIQGPNFALVNRALLALCKKYGSRLRVHIWGFKPPKGWKTQPNMHFIPVNYDYESYAHQLAELHWDIALVPLAEDAFNLSKSPIKWLEYSSLGIASIFSDIAVYRDVVQHNRTGLLVPDSPAAWLEAISSLIEDGEKRRGIAQAAQDEVREKYDINRNADQYDQCYREITSAVTQSIAAKAVTAGSASQVAPQKRRMVVYSVDPKNSPCSQIRWLRPFRLLQNDWDFHWPMNEQKQGSLAALEAADIVVLHRTIAAELSREVLDAILNCGKPVIYESDDLLNEIPQYHRDNARPQKDAIEHTIRHAHAVVVSSQYLADKYRLMNPEVRVLPNFVDFKLFYSPVPAVADIVTIGLLGTSIQGPNFSLVDQALRELCEKYGARLRVHIWGFKPPEGWESHPNMHFIPVNYDYESYAHQLASLNWDIALIPLTEDEFNLSKSPIKWLEYSCLGIASIFSDIAVYREVVEHDRTGLLVPDSPQAWSRAITSLVEDGEKRRKIAQAAQDEVRERFDINRNADQYNRCYRELTDYLTQRIAENTLPRPVAVPISASTPAPTLLTAEKSEKKRLVVLSIESTWSPCPQIRFILPFAFLEDEWELIWAIQDGKIDFAAIQRADLVVMHRFTPGLFPIKDLQTIFNLGKPMVYETDDLLNDIPDYHPLAADSKKWKAGIEFAVKNSRAVVVSTHFLANKYRTKNSRIHVLPNYLDFDRFYREVPDGENDQITIGLLGTSIQGPNFALVEAALQAICGRYPGRIKIYFMGWALPDGWENHPAVHFVPFVHEYRTYAERLLEMQWDIALVPLVDDDFNHSKSAIKWLEYAAAGIAPVFSDVSVYRDVVHHGRTGLLVPNAPDAWLGSLTSLIDNAALRRRIARTAQAEVRKHYSLIDQAALYCDVYRSLTGAGRASPASSGSAPADPVKGILLLDIGGDPAEVQLSLRSLVDAKLDKLVTIVLTAREGTLPEWTDTLRYVQVRPDEFAVGVGQLSGHPEFDWVVIAEAGDTLLI
jgi:glycosyltransferase involved in cell wall biosynthesis